MLDAWQRWAPQLPREASIEAYLVCSDYDDEPAHVEVWGVSSGDDLTGAVGALVPVPPEVLRGFALAPRDAARYLSGWQVRANESLWVPEGPFDQPAHADVKSEFVAREVAFEALVENLTRDRAYGEYRDVELTPWGGAYASAVDNCVTHRDPLLLISHTVVHAFGTGTRTRAIPTPTSTARTGTTGRTPRGCARSSGATIRSRCSPHASSKFMSERVIQPALLALVSKRSSQVQPARYQSREDRPGDSSHGCGGQPPDS